MITYMKCPGKADLYRWKVDLWLPGPDEWEPIVIASGYKRSSGFGGSVLRLDGGDGCSTLHTDYKLLNCTLQMNGLYAK